MPITPDQYRDHVNRNLQAVVDAIDAILTEQAKAGRTLPQSVSLAVIAQQAKVAVPHVHALTHDIINLYGANNWMVEYTLDQRDGDYFRFDAAPGA